MKRSLFSFVVFLSLLLPLAATESFGAYDLGTKDMVIGAGVTTVSKPTRSKTVNITAPATLSQSDTEYVLQNDIVASGTAFTIKGSNITLNLNGHTVTYGNSGSSSAYGVYVDGYARSNIAVVNGKIVQGNGSCSGQSGTGTNCNPIYAYETFSMEIGGVDISYRAADTHGIYLQWGKDASIHHSSIQDLGTKVTDRHQGIDAIRAVGVTNAKVHHSIVKTRQVGIRVGTNGEIYNNEVTINSQVTNSVGVSLQTGSAHHNKVYGYGVHPIAFWPDHDAKVYSNYAEVQNTKSGSEYGDTGAACLRMTWGTGDNSEIMYNTFIVNASDSYNGTGVNSWGRALFVGLPDASLKADIHDNVIIATNNDGKGKAAGIAIVTNNLSPNLKFRNNRVESNWANVLLADDYGHADGYARFIDNTFVKRDNYSNYKTVRSQYSSLPSTGVFTGNTMENGASMENIDLEFSGTGKKDIFVYWHLGVTVKNSSGTALSGASVSVKDSTGKVVYSGQTGSNGSITTDVLQFEAGNLSGSTVVSREVKTTKTPYTITVSKDGLTAAKSVTVNANMTVDMTLGAANPDPTPAPTPTPTPTPTPAPGATFADVPSSYWAASYINAIYEKGLTQGCGNGNYCPDDYLTRGQIGTFLTRAKYGENFTYTTTPYFSDVPSDNGYFKYIQKFRDDRITWTDGVYGVNDLVSKGVMAVFIIRAKYGENFTYTTTPYFSDVPSSNFYFKYVQKLKDDGITKATGTFGVDLHITRADMAVFLSRAFLGM